jgi:pyruvate formate lyase activating enzyme
MSTAKYEAEGIVFDIQRYSIHDGPGIRTIAFLKGCPLSCKWCSNPESQRLRPEVMYQRKNCISCGRCLTVCKAGALSPENPAFVDRKRCVGCGACADICPTDALILKGKIMTVWEVMQILQKDATVYRRSNGGITLSGGEPLMQSAFSVELLRACRENGWHTAMETTGLASRAVLEKVVPLLDLVLLDVKSANPEKHKAHTGVDNRAIRENAACIARLAKEIVVRVPVVPGFNFSVQDAEDIGSFALAMGNIREIHLLAYHTYGENKYELLGRTYPMGDAPRLKAADLEPMRAVLERQGFACTVGG